MAARIRKVRHDDETRAKIQTSQLINRLSDHVFGKVVLDSSQVRAIEVLLRKTLPDLSAIDMTAKHDVSDALVDLLKAVDGKSRGLPTRA